MKKVNGYLVGIVLGGGSGLLIHLIFHGITEIYLIKRMAADSAFFLNKLSYPDLLWLHHFVYGVDALFWFLIGGILGIYFYRKGLFLFKLKR